MNIIDFFKERIAFIVINIVILIFTSVLLVALKVDSYAIVFIFIINLVGILIFHFYEFFKKKKYYGEIKKDLYSLDKKYLVSEIVAESDFIEGKIIHNIISEANKSMNDEIAKYKLNIDEYREYIEMWVHEIKTPIATCKLLIENNNSEVTRSIGEELERVQDYIEQSLYYTRSNTLEKDYIIKEINLSDSINNIIRKNANTLIAKQIKINIYDVDKKVYCDSKWMEFILNQIISNSIKYMNKKNSELKIYCDKVNEDVILNICDNGIGMDEKDIVKAFDKGYTGQNGRIFGKSTGIGLYLCKKLCGKLGLGIKLGSKEGIGTKVSIIFPINNLMKF